MAYTTINKPSDYFNTKLYTGNGTSQSITGVNFQPDFTWIKRRSASAWSNNLFDSVRGVGKGLLTDSTNSEETNSVYGYLNSFDSDGFSVTAGTTDANRANASGIDYVSWNWLAGNTSGSSNTQGDITSTVSANTTSGFSIVNWTGTEVGATVGHGLGATPKMIIVKTVNDVDDWWVYHNYLGNTGGIILNSSSASGTSATAWNSTSPTSSVFSVGALNATNRSGGSMIAYCFAEKKGFSKFGSYTGNNSNDGTFVYTGFKPAFVIIKNITSAAKNWVMLDNKRDSYNGVTKWLYSNTSGAEIDQTLDPIDFCSNGFKIRTSGSYVNAAETYIYMAFAEHPLVSSTGTPCTAR